MMVTHTQKHVDKIAKTELEVVVQRARKSNNYFCLLIVRFVCCNEHVLVVFSSQNQEKEG
jgi:hypothetical protein